MSAKENMAAAKKGYKNGIGAMSAEERTAAAEKGYENGIGAMLVEERTAAGEKRYKNGRLQWVQGVDPFDVYLNKQALHKSIMRYQNNPKFSFSNEIYTITDYPRRQSKQPYKLPNSAFILTSAPKSPSSRRLR